MMSYLLEWMVRGCREPREEIVETFLEAAPYRQLRQRRKELREARNERRQAGGAVRNRSSGLCFAGTPPGSVRT